MTTTKSRAVRRRTGSIIEVAGKRGVSYKLKFDLPSPTGARKTYYRTVRGTYAEAEAELARLVGQAGAGVDLGAARQTLADWIDTWLEHIRPDVSQTTIEGYRTLLTSYVVPALGHHSLAALGPMQLERLYNQLAVSGRTRRRHSGDTSLSPRTISHIHRCLHQPRRMVIYCP